MLINHASLVRFISSIFSAAGCDEAESARIAENLSEANLMGHDSHGVIRTPRYVSWLKDGKLVADQKVSVVSETGALAVLDGCYGFGQTVGPQAVDYGMKRAREHGSSVIALQHAGHLGRIGAWAEMAAAEGQVSVHFVNVAGSVLVAPFGGTERRFSTAPVAIGVPRAGNDPLVLDFSTAMVAEGKVLVASQGGKALPPDCLIGPDGLPGNDPKLLYGETDTTRFPDRKDGDGALRALGDYKGSGLALMCELLAGALTGSGATGKDYGRIYNGMLSIYLPVENFDDDGFAAEVKRYVDFVKSAQPAEPDGEILMPGESEQRLKAERLKGGIPIADHAWAALAGVGNDLGVDVPVEG